VVALFFDRELQVARCSCSQVCSLTPHFCCLLSVVNDAMQFWLSMP
jgi:hypothetical protein